MGAPRAQGAEAHLKQGKPHSKHSEKGGPGRPRDPRASEEKPQARKRSNEVKITERAVRLELSLQHRPDAILNLGGLLQKNCLKVLPQTYDLFVYCFLPTPLEPGLEAHYVK